MHGHGHGQRTYSDKDDQWGSGGDPESGPRSADSGPYTRLMGTFSFKSYISLFFHFLLCFSRRNFVEHIYLISILYILTFYD